MQLSPLNGQALQWQCITISYGLNTNTAPSLNLHCHQTVAHMSQEKP